MRTNQNLFRWMGVVLSVFAGLGRGAEAKQAKNSASKSKKEDGKPHLQVADAVGVFRLGYVDCHPYGGPEQIISIEQDGAIECIQQQEGIPGVTDGRNRSFKGRQELGRLRAGSLLKGEIESAPGFQSKAANPAEAISGVRIQVVSLPGGPGVWLAMRSKAGGLTRTWDEIYVRMNQEASQEVLV